MPAPGFPAAPYAISPGIVSLYFAPLLMSLSASVQPAITALTPNSETFPRLWELSNILPLSSQPE